MAGGPFCIDCRHYGRSFEDIGCWSDQCHRPLTTDCDPVTGKIARRVWKSCASERRSKVSLFGRIRCGPDGMFHEPR